MRAPRKTSSITELPRAARSTPAPRGALAPIVARSWVAQAYVAQACVAQACVARACVASPRITPAWVTPFRSCIVRSLGGVMIAALVVMGGACSRPAPGTEQQQASESHSPVSATFQLAPAAVDAVAKPPPSPVENVLAATASDPTPSSAAAPAPGSPLEICINGWSTPERGTALRSAALDMMRVRRGERFFVEEMRYFVGPEDAEVIGPRGDVERWYVKAFTDTEPRRRQRWLVRRSPVGSGVDAVAPFDSRGYGPRTWRRPDASDPSLADPFERPCQGTKPGEMCTGLPREVLGCLSGT